MLVSLLPLLPGDNQKQRVDSLWLLMRAYYKEEHSGSRLTNLVYTMIKRPKETARLHSKAGECRSLIKFGWQQAVGAMAARPGDP